MQFLDGFTSRTLKLIAYDEIAYTLYLQMTEGDVVLAAKTVPASLYLAFIQSPSKSAFLARRVRPFFRIVPVSARARRQFEDQLYQAAGQGARSRALALLNHIES